jgi:hypothetical protein
MIADSAVAKGRQRFRALWDTLDTNRLISDWKLA